MEGGFLWLCRLDQSPVLLSPWHNPESGQAKLGSLWPIQEKAIMRAQALRRSWQRTRGQSLNSKTESPRCVKKPSSITRVAVAYGTEALLAPTDSLLWASLVGSPAASPQPREGGCISVIAFRYSPGPRVVRAEEINTTGLT